MSTRPGQGCLFPVRGLKKEIKNVAYPFLLFFMTNTVNPKMGVSYNVAFFSFLLLLIFALIATRRIPETRKGFLATGNKCVMCDTTKNTLITHTRLIPD